MNSFKRLKVMTVVGTRPEIIRLSRVIAALNASPSIEHILVHTGQNFDYELNDIFFTDLEIPLPDIFLNAAADNAAKTIGVILQKIDDVLDAHNPDAFLILGDTNSCLCAISAKRRKIPVFHMEAGNRCFDQRVPEEINRKIVDHISDINLPYSSIAREYLLREGIPADRIIKTGSPMFEVLQYYKSKIDASDILSRLGIEKSNYFVASVHREENISNDYSIKQLLSAFNAISVQYNLPVIISIHPRTAKRIEQLHFNFHEKVHRLKPLSFSDYNHLQLNARCVLSDSGTISEESSILGFPAINIREAHERPEAMEQGAVIMTGWDHDRILQSIQQVIYLQSKCYLVQQVDDYIRPDVSEKVVKIILSYTNYVNRVVWQR